jgi:hypothetical protein
MSPCHTFMGHIIHGSFQRGSDDKPKTASEIGHFTKEDKNTFNCALLFNSVFMLCILLYRIGNGGNKLFVFVFVRKSKLKFLLASMKSHANCKIQSSNPLQRACSGFLIAACVSNGFSVTRL